MNASAGATMDFFGRQEVARRRSRRLVALFGGCVVATLAALNALVAFGAGVALRLGSGAGGPWFRWDGGMAAWVTGITLLFIVASAAIEWVNLAGGGTALAERLGAVPVPPATGEPSARRLLNIVEEMAIASGVPAPRVYVLSTEAGVNAFTAGLTPSDTVIAVTRDALEQLSRDELQGVIAHEFSHLLHDDVRVDLRLAGLLSGLLFIPEMGLDLLRASWVERTDDDGRGTGGSLGPAILFAPAGAVLVAVGYVGFLGARAVQAAAARQRELRADAAAVQFTRNPAGLGGALRKLSTRGGTPLAGTGAAERLGHLFFAETRHAWFFRGFDTHPSPAVRLAALGAAAGGSRPTLPAAEPGPSLSLGQVVAQMAGLRADLGSFVDSAGTPTALHLSRARNLVAELPPEVLTASRDPLGAPALVLGLLLDPGSERQRRQIDRLAARAQTGSAELPPGIVAALEPLAEPVSRLGRDVRLPLLNLVLPALRALPGGARTGLLRAARELAEGDGEIRLFEFVLLKALERQLCPAAGPGALRPAFGRDLVQFAPEIETVLSLLSRAGTATTSAAEHAFAEAGRLLPALGHRIGLRPSSSCGLDAFSEALDRLAPAAPGLRRVVLAAAARAACADGRTSVDEAELIRAVADALDCPLPPLIDMGVA